MNDNFSIISLKKKKLILVLISGISLTIFFSLTSLFIGAVKLDLINLLFGKSDVKNLELVMNVRAPRIVTAIIVGASLSVAGAVMQNIFRNPLVDPYITGVASGAAFTTSLSVLLGITFLSPASLYALPVMAFIGAIIALILTLFFARLAGGTYLSLLLSGIAISFLFSSATTIVVTTSAGKTYGIIFWLFGSLITSSWKFIYIMAPISIVVLCYILFNARRMNVLMLGDDEARQLGVNVSSLRRNFVISLSLLTSISVAFNGIIGFIGLIAPHISRLLVGEDHRILLPSTIFTGGIILILADLAARTFIAPAELPIGALTSSIGAPFFLFLLIKMHRRYR
ncbi:MAG: iron ABC transporter permease [Nitrososphaeria archaeon]|nr:iron ABC transporter permease [Nitrososphaeria archaeon]